MNLQEQLKAILLAMRATSDDAEKSGRDFTAEEREMLKRQANEVADLKGKIKAAEGDAALRKQILELGAGIEYRAQGDQSRQPRAPAGRGKSIGEQFVEAEAYKAWYKQIAPTGYIPEGTKGLLSPPVEYKNLLGRKTILTGDSSTSGGAFVQTDYSGLYEPLGRRPLTLRDLISNRTTTSDVVEFVRQTAKVTQAAPTAEANVATYAGSTGQVEGAKPEGAMAFEKVTAAVKTIAVWVPATKRAISDAGQLRGIIDQELRDDLEEDLEDEIIGGDNSGEHFQGIDHTSGVLTQAWDTDLPTTARKAITALRVTGRTRPTAWAMNPEDAERVDLLKDGVNRYYAGGPLDGGALRLWRYPIVECEAVEAGEAILGDWRKAVLWDREQATIQISDSHADFFIRNIVAVLAEARAAFGLLRPSGFIKVEFTAGT